jgi:hypothetical protein
MSDEKQVTAITLDANRVIGPLHKTLEECTNSILFGLQTMELVDEIPSDLKIDEGFFRLQFGKNNEDIEVQKEKYKAWLIKKGFEDLVKGIEYTLREAYFYVSIFSKFSNKQILVDDFNQAFAEIRKKALEMHIPVMIEKIEPHLTKSWSYKNQILSINRVRACLVHRGGLVTEKDINDKTEKALKLEWVKNKIFYEKDREEIEIIGETIIDGGTEGTQIKLRQENNTVSFEQGSHITFNYKLFNEFIVTCFRFGADLVDCLPKEIK